MARKKTGILGRCRAAFRRFGATEGNVAVEFGLFLPIVLMVILASVELGRYGVETNRLANAARAGMQYAIQGQGYAKSTDWIIDAVRLDAGDTANSLTVTSRWFCRCSGSGEVDCAVDCPDENYPTMYVQIAVSETFETLFPLLATSPTFQMPLSLSPSVVTTARVR